MSKEILFDKYGNEIVKLEVKYNNKLQSICMNCFRIGGVKWNDIDNGSFLTLTINKKDLIDQLVENEVKFDFDEDDNGETVKQVIVDNEKYIDIEYFARTKADLEAKLAEKEHTITTLIEDHKASQEWYKKQLAEKEKELENYKLCKCVNCTNEYEFMLEGLVGDLEKEIDKANQDKISFAVDILEELADCSNYINSKLDFECGSYVSEKVIRDKIKDLKGNENE